MKLWTDIIDPATLSGYARASLEDYERSKGTLARWLPNREVSDIVARFVKGQFGLVPIARFRAYDAEPELEARQQGKRITVELPAVGQNIPIGEYDQLRLQGRENDEDAVLAAIQTTTRQVVQAVADAAERMRGVVLSTGKATIDQDNFQSDDDFARPAEHQLVATSLWSSATSVSRLAYLQTLHDIFVDTTGEEPGAIVMSTRVMRVMGQGDEFKTQLLTGSRPANEDEILSTVSGAGLPPIFKYDRRVKVGTTVTKVMPDDGILMLPAPVEPDNWEGTDLGGTFWGRTLTSTDPEWSIEASEQPGIVAGVYRNPKPPMGAEVISDAIALPVLANAEKSLWAKVL